jgi:hypothetical protein
MPVDIYPDEGRVLTVECRDASHEPKVVGIATFREQLMDNGSRANIMLVGAKRTTRDGIDLIKHAQRHVEIGPDSDGQIVRDTGPNPVIETLVYVDDDTPLDDTFGDVGRDRRFHYQLRCPLCDVNVSTRHETLYPVLEQLIDGGMSRIGLSRLGAILKPH